MPLADYTAYKAAKPFAKIGLIKVAQSTTPGRLYSHWIIGPNGATAPSATVVCVSTTTGSVASRPSSPASISATPSWVKTARHSRNSGGTTFVLDRLSHQGGLSGNVATTQTTNLPTAALTRYTSGVGVFAFLEVFSSVGVTATTFSVSYTNSAGVSGRVSPASTVGATGTNATGTFIPIPLQVGDVGVRSVESVTLAGATGTAGNIGIVLAKPLITISTCDESYQFVMDQVKHMGACFEPIAADACLMLATACLDDPYLRVGVLELIKQV